MKSEQSCSFQPWSSFRQWGRHWIGTATQVLFCVGEVHYYKVEVGITKDTGMRHLNTTPPMITQQSNSWSSFIFSFLLMWKPVSHSIDDDGNQLPASNVIQQLQFALECSRGSFLQRELISSVAVRTRLCTSPEQSEKGMADCHCARG